MAERELTYFSPRPRHPRPAASRETCRNSPHPWLTPMPGQVALATSWIVALAIGSHKRFSERSATF
jgi:hypothetical protein